MNKDFNVKKILIPFDFSDTAALSLDHAVNMAKLKQSEIVLLHIVETVTLPSSLSHAFSGFEKKVESASNERLQELADNLKLQHGIQVHILTDVGKIYKQITHTAKQAHIDLIIMGTHGAEGHKYSIGSNTTRVVQESPCPVLAVQHAAKKLGFERIVLPIDDSPESRQKVNHALEIARMYNSEIIVVGLMSSSGEDYSRKFRIKIEQVEDWLTEHGIKCSSQLVQSDDRAKTTLRVAAENKGDLVIIMTEQEPSLAGMLLGTYASKVVNHSKIPILTVRPAEIDPDRITVTF
jgi:nucleotide-binding universal stress UspA family protein